MAQRLLVLDGMDGAGKTTIWEALKEYMPEALFLKEPSIPCSTLSDFVEDRRHQWNALIAPALMEENRDVVMDRYILSTLSYQTAGGVMTSDMWAWMRQNTWFYQCAVSFTVLCVCDPIVAQERIKARGNKDLRWENREGLNRQWRDFNMLGAVLYNSRTIDTTSLPIDEAVKIAKEAFLG